jgi:hypothetical protein
LHDLVGAGFGAVAVPLQVIDCTEGIGLPPFALNVTLYLIKEIATLLLVGGLLALSHVPPSAITE